MIVSKCNILETTTHSRKHSIISKHITSSTPLPPTRRIHHTKLLSAVVMVVILCVTLNTTPTIGATAATTSFFRQRCGIVDYNSFEDALGVCYSAGEYLAAPHNDEEMADLMSVVSPNNVVGGILTTNNAWKWLEGPYADRIYYLAGKGSVGPMNFPYTAAATLTGTPGTRFTISTGTGEFSTATKSPFPPSIRCSICQSIQNCKDVCSSFGTQSFTGTAHENCNCVCRPGYTGKYCDFQTSYFCQGTTVTLPAASASCAAKGGFLATPTTPAIMGELRAQYNYSAGTNVLIGGDDGAVEGQWLWSTGPDAGRQFWQGLSTGVSMNGYTSYFSAGEPNDYNHPAFPGGEDSLCFRDYIWNDCNVKGNDVKCYVCQFSVCNASSPCVGANTVSASGTQFDNCSCTCKPGFGGTYCQCPENGCDPRGGTLVQNPTSCSCVCKPNFNGVNCSERTVTAPHTLTAPISNTTSIVPTPSKESTRTPSLPITPSDIVTTTRTRPPTPTISHPNTKSQQLTTTRSIPATATLHRNTKTKSLTSTLPLPPTETNQRTTTRSLPPTPTSTSTLSKATPSQSIATTHTLSELCTLTSTNPTPSLFTSTRTGNITTTASLLSTATPSLLLTTSTSLSTTNSSDPTTSSSITLTASREETLSCPAVLWRTACDMLTWQLSGGNETVSNATTVATTNTTTGGCVPTLFVPFAVWENGDVRAAIRFPPSKLLPRAVPPPNATSSDVRAPAPVITITSLGAFALSRGELLEVVIRRRDDAGLGRAVHQVKLPNWLFGCGLPFALVSEVVYEARPRNLAAQGVQDAGNGIGTASSVLTGSPGAVVRGGVMSTVSGLMRCSSVDVTEEVSWLNNPMGISVGSEDGASLRGSVMSGVIMVVVGLVLCGVVIGGTAGWAVINGETVPGWRELIARGRLPSSVVAVVALSMEIGTGSAMTLLTMGTEFGSIGDRIGGAIYIVAAAVYCGHVCSACIRAPVHAVEVPPLPDRSSTMRKVTKYLFQPTHELELNGCAEEEVSDVSKRAKGVRDREWVRRNAFYTADLRWPLFRGIELFVGLAANLVEGFAVGTMTGCLVRIVLMILTLSGTVVLLLVTRACSIRAMLWSTVLLNALMAVAAVLALVNVMASSPGVEEGADWLLMLAAIIIVVQSVIDMVLTAVTVIPATRSCFGYLRKRFGEDINGGGRNTHGNDDDDLGQPAPLLEIVDADLGDNDYDGGGYDGVYSPPQSPTKDAAAAMMDLKETSYVHEVANRVSKAPLEHGRNGEEEEVEVDHQVEWIYAQPTSFHQNDGDAEVGDEPNPNPKHGRHGADGDDHIPEDFLKYLEDNGFDVDNNINDEDDDQQHHLYHREDDGGDDDVVQHEYDEPDDGDDEELEELIFGQH